MEYWQMLLSMGEGACMAQTGTNRDDKGLYPREKKRPTVHFGTPWASGTCADGGGGGSRTPVREHSTQSVYRFRSGTNFTTLLAPDRAQSSNPAGTDLVETPGRRQAPPA